MTIMKTIQLKVSETDAERYNLGNQKEVEFADLVDKISLEYATFSRKAVLECNEIAEKVALFDMTLDEIDAEIKVVRDAKNNS